MDHWSIANPDATLDVEANKLFETRPRILKKGLRDSGLLSPRALRLKFAGSHTGPANRVPFKSIAPQAHRSRESLD